MGDLNVKTVGATTQTTGAKGAVRTPRAQDTKRPTAPPASDQASVTMPPSGTVPATGAMTESDTLDQARQERVIGISEYRQGNFRAAREHLSKSVVLFKVLADAGNLTPQDMVEWTSTISDLGRSIYNIKDVSEDQHKKNLESVSALYDVASENFKELVHHPELQGYAPLFVGILGLNLNVALAYHEQGLFDEAENLLKTNQSLAVKLGDLKELSLSLSQTSLNLALVYAAKGEIARRIKDVASARAQFRAAQNVLAQADERVKRAGTAGDVNWGVQGAVVHQRQAFLALRLAKVDGTATPKGNDGLKEAKRLAELAQSEFQQYQHQEGVKATQQLLEQIKSPSP